MASSKITLRIYSLCIHSIVFISLLFSFSFWEMIKFYERMEAGKINFARFYQELSYNMAMFFEALLIFIVAYVLLLRAKDTALALEKSNNK